MKSGPGVRIHAHRVARRHCDHRGSDRAVASGDPEGAARPRRGCAVQNNLKQCAIGLHNYHDIHGKFPGATERSPTRYTSLFVELLPFVEQDPLYKQWDFATPRTNASSGRVAVVIKTYICPSHPNAERLVRSVAGSLP